MLPYSAEAYLALFVDYNQDIRPVPALAIFLAAGIIALAVRSTQDRGRLICGLLAAGWAWTGAVWFFLYFRDLNFAAPLYGALFLLQSVLVGWLGVVRRRIDIRFDGSAASIVGLGVMAVAAIGMPLLDWLIGSSWTETRLALLAPGTTAALTAGVLLLSAARARYFLMAIPAIWLLATGLHGWILDMPRDYILAAAGVFSLLALVLSGARRHRRSM